MMKRTLGLVSGLVLLATLALQGCGRTQSKGKPGTAGLEKVTSLDVYKDGSTVNLLLGGPVGKQIALRYLRSTDGGATWSAPVAVDTGSSPPYDVHRGDDAQIAAHSKHLLAIWPTHGSGWGGSGPMASAISNDGGKSWQPGPDPGHGGKRGEAFIDAAADAAGRFHVVWLDARSGQQGLHYARSTDYGRHWSSAQTIDPATCQCCWNTLRPVAHDRLYVLYRNVNPRDMGLAVSTDGGESWQQRGPVGAFDWHFKACPHTGGGLTVTSGPKDAMLRAIVWTGKKGHVGVHYLMSKKGGQSWNRPRRIGNADARHADMAMLDGRHVAIVWDTATAANSAILITRSDDGGRTWSTQRRVSPAHIQATNPRIIATAHGYRVFWTQSDGRWAMTMRDGAPDASGSAR
jgi:hypothetical protein